MTEVSRHRRRTASGKTTTVRQHTRNTGGGGGGSDRPREATGGPAPYVGDMRDETAGDPPPGGEDWWADDIDDGWGGNYAAPGATVGMQARDVTITGGLGIFTDRHEPPRGPREPAGGDWEPEVPPGANVASGNDRVAFQVGSIRPRRTRPSSEHTAAERRLFGTDTPGGAAAFDRSARLRETHGWTGSMDSSGRIPDPDNPANAWFIGTMKPADVQAMRDARANLPADFRGE